MENTLKLMADFESRNNLSITLEINSDGSGCVREFWDDEEIKEFNNIAELDAFLITGRLELDSDGRCISPVKII